MAQSQQIVIPTLSRAKFSRNLSYPVGAESISVALASTAQLADLKLHFYHGFDHALRRGEHEFLRVEYLSVVRPAEKWPISSLYKRPPQGPWEIVVQPVPRSIRHRVKQYILDSALKQIAHWLGDRKEFVQPGSDILAFFYSEQAEEFIARQLTSAEPLRVI